METHENVDRWAEIVLEKWQRAIRKLRIGDSGELFDSLARQVVSASDGDVQKVIFFYNYYGAFVDMGVGRGVKVGGVKESALSRRLEGKRNGNRRRAKKWHNKILYGQTIRLGEIMQDEYGNAAVVTIIDNLPPQITLSL